MGNLLATVQDNGALDVLEEQAKKPSSNRKRNEKSCQRSV